MTMSKNWGYRDYPPGVISRLEVCALGAQWNAGTFAGTKKIVLCKSFDGADFVVKLRCHHLRQILSDLASAGPEIKNPQLRKRLRVFSWAAALFIWARRKPGCRCAVRHAPCPDMREFQIPFYALRP
ncbi:hypothetical protein [Achromobacter insolitus]|uniref:hypothetical protein n=1 Tax=Achromobacter insolitus TaxID=217204 RepID=UPI0028A89A05|nr:hypothetical protein [Achromobacter insolitus]